MANVNFYYLRRYRADGCDWTCKSADWIYTAGYARENQTPAEIVAEWNAKFGVWYQYLLVPHSCVKRILGSCDWVGEKIWKAEVKED